MQEENGKLKAQIKTLEKELLSVKIKNTVLENENKRIQFPPVDARDPKALEWIPSRVTTKNSNFTLVYHS